MKSTEPVQQLTSPIQKSYNRAVFSTYIGVIVMALWVAWVAYGDQKLQVMNEREQQIDRHVLQVDLLLESSIRAIKSLRDVAVDYLNRGEPAENQTVPKYENFSEKDHVFSLEPEYSKAGKPFTNMGQITGLGSLKHRNEHFYRELQMLYELSLSFPVAKDTAQKTSAIYYISKQKMMSYYPWPSDNSRYREELLNQKQFQLVGPEMNPQRSVSWRPAYVDSTSKGLLTTLEVPIYNNDSFMGSINLDMTLAELSKQIRLYFKMPGTVILLDQNNNVLFHSDIDSTDMTRVYHISQRIPAELHSLSESDLFETQDGFIRNGYYIHSVALHNAPWRLLYLQSVDDMFSDAWGKLQMMFFLVFVALSLLVTIVHWQTRRSFVNPASQLLSHLEGCSQEPLPVPAKTTQGWMPWFQLVSRIFEENQQYTHHLAEQNKRLDKLVALRTDKLKETTERREREYALLRSLIDSIPEAIIFKDKEGKYLGCNKAAETNARLHRKRVNWANFREYD